MAKPPELGMYIERRITGLRGSYTHSGLVTDHLSAQFGYLSAEGSRGLCLYSEDWKPVAKRAKKEVVLVEAPSVWRNHQSRTCIVVEASTSEVKYIPMSVDEPFDVHTQDEVRFRTMNYIEPIEYPVERAARLFVEYARATGATDAALEELSKFTTITPEEKEMAKQRKNAADDKGPAEKKKPAAKKKAEAKQKKAPAEKKRTMGQAFTELLMQAGKNGECKFTDDQIFEKVQKEFDLEEKKRSYVAWYRNKLVKDGANPPERKGGPAPKKGRGRPAKDAPAKKAPAKKAPAKKKQGG